MEAPAADKSQRLTSFLTSPFFMALLVLASIVFTLETYQTYGNPDHFIGHADQAQMALVARNIAEGRGAVSECYWLLHGVEKTNHGTLPHPEGYWSYYVPHILSGPFQLFGSNRFSIVALASLLKIVTAVAASIACYLSTCSRAMGFTCGAFLLLHESMLMRVNGLSDIYLTASFAVVFLLFSLCLYRCSLVYAILAGVFAGLAIGIKPSGLLVLGLFPACVFFQRLSIASIRNLILVFSVCLLCVAPMLIFNRSNGDSYLLPPDYPRVASGMHSFATYKTGFNGANFDPDLVFGEPLDFGTRVKLSVISLLRNTKLLTDREFPVSILPFTVIGLICGLKRYCIAKYQTTSFDQVYRALALTISIGGLIFASQIHFEVRYFNFLVPVITVVAFSAIHEFDPIKRKTVCVFLLISSLLPAVLYFWSQPQINIIAKNKRFVDACHLTKEILSSDATVLTSDPWEFSFHSRLKAVSIPYTDSPETVQRIARRFGAQYLVFIDEYARHPSYEPLFKGEYPDYLSPVHKDSQLLILKLDVSTDE